MMTITKISFILLSVSVLVTGMVGLAVFLQSTTGTTGSMNAAADPGMNEYNQQLNEKISQLQPPTSTDTGPFSIVSNAWSTLIFIFTQFPSLLISTINTAAAWVGAPKELVGAIILAAGLFMSYSILRIIFKTEV